MKLIAEDYGCWRPTPEWWRVVRLDREVDDTGRLVYHGPSRRDAEGLAEWLRSRGVPAVASGSSSG